MKERIQEPRTAARREACGQGGRGRRRAREGRREARTGSRDGQVAPRHRQSQRPVLAPRLWYGMPDYVRDGNVVCFFQSARDTAAFLPTFIEAMRISQSAIPRGLL
jgi:hypothetical protein